MIRWLQCVLLRIRIASAERELEYSRKLLAYQADQVFSWTAALRRDRAALARLDCPARALRLIKRGKA